MSEPKTDLSDMWALLTKVIDGYSKYPMTKGDWKNYTDWCSKKISQYASIDKVYGEDFEMLSEIAARHIYEDQKRNFPNETY